MPRKKRTSTTRIERPGGTFPVALALGGNLGPVEQTLGRALRSLATSLGPLRVASLYRTTPVSPIAQPDFLNTAAVAHTGLAPEAVLALAKALELAAGRRPPGESRRFGPRPLDVDLLLYGDRQSAAPELTLPHPRLRERRFMLEPLAEIAPDWLVPPEGLPVRELLARLGDSPGVERVAWSRHA
ncbi:MAG TPA: 2-amino-4-hydroxy-6-hydroxymethyldihydropteridine diphosphokinase [Thermoanaerobaculia bacterium]|nr:2-amino-4-hydroxy-6-hydroxymethyldihydropteridine diphosphokinase [Thermoanaerobaculia bacterium]